MSHNERCKDCKQRIADFLRTIFGKVEGNYDIDLPAGLEDYSRTSIYNDISAIYGALINYRGFNSFVKSKKLPRIDIYLPNRNIIVEFDESQHFSAPRRLSLSLYPKSKRFGFSVDRWSKLCLELNKRDNDPPFRDEQRAWYDTLRDFAPILWGEGKTIRLFARDFIWCSLKVKNASDVEQFKEILLGQNRNADHGK